MPSYCTLFLFVFNLIWMRYCDEPELMHLDAKVLDSLGYKVDGVEL